MAAMAIAPRLRSPRLAGLGEKYLLKQLVDIQSGDRPIAEMTGLLTGMSEQDLADMRHFTMLKHPGLPVPETTPSR